MSLGNLVKTYRATRGYTLQTLSNATGTDTGTISRIENEQTEATIITALRLCRCLNISYDKLYHSLQNTSLGEILDPHIEMGGGWENSTEGQSESTISNTEDFACSSVAREEDIDALLQVFLSAPDDGRKLLAKWLTGIMRTQDSNTSSNKPIEAELTIEDIDKILSPSALIYFEIKYPPFKKAKDIVNVYKCKGIMVMTDAQMLARILREQAGEKRIKGRQMESILSRIESDDIQRLRLIDIINLDRELQDYGNFLGILWRIYSYKDRKFARLEEPSSEQPIKFEDSYINRLASLFVHICRWYQYFYGLDGPWLEKFRGEMAMSQTN